MAETDLKAQDGISPGILALLASFDRFESDVELKPSLG